MKLFLLRHADAQNTCPDENRRLSEKGRAQIGGLVSRLRPGSFPNLAQIWHSTYARAEETARGFADKAGLEVPIVRTEGLSPCDGPHHAARLVASVSQMGADLLIVGHNPHLEELASLLVVGNPGRRIVRFKKCSLLCLDLESEPVMGNEYGSWSISGFVS